MNQMHEGNRACWNGWAKWWSGRRDEVGVWERCHREPQLVLSPGEMAAIGDVHGKQVCVLGSGDNEVVFALAGMGALVTSVDISDEQLSIAAEKARRLALEVTFIRGDVTCLPTIPSASFHIVHTGIGVVCWISDLRKFYSEAARILRPDGVFVVNEFHPFSVMFSADKPWPLQDYSHRGPFTYTSNEGFPGTEHHWTVADRIQTMLDVGLVLTRIEEHDGTVADRDLDSPGQAAGDSAKGRDLSPPKIPRCLLLVGKKATNL